MKHEMTTADYEYYGRFDSLPLASFVLILHGINPGVFNQSDLEQARMFEPLKSVWQQPIAHQIPNDTFEQAKTTYQLLKSTAWRVKYEKKGDPVIWHNIPWKHLMVEANEKRINMPEELIGCFDKFRINLTDVILQEASQVPTDPIKEAEQYKSKNNSASRENTLKIAIALILSEQNISSGAHLYAKVRGRAAGNIKILGEDRGTRLINRWVMAKQFPCKKPRDYKELENEIQLGVLCAVAYQLKNQFLANEPDVSIALISDPILEKLKLYHFNLSAEEIKSAATYCLSFLTAK